MSQIYLSKLCYRNLILILSFSHLLCSEIKNKKKISMWVLSSPPLSGNKGEKVKRHKNLVLQSSKKNRLSFRFGRMANVVWIYYKNILIDHFTLELIYILLSLWLSIHFFFLLLLFFFCLLRLALLGFLVIIKYFRLFFSLHLPGDDHLNLNCIHQFIFNLFFISFVWFSLNLFFMI